VLAIGQYLQVIKNNSSGRERRARERKQVSICATRREHYCAWNFVSLQEFFRARDRRLRRAPPGTAGVREVHV
jgi:hypothetical protein